MTEFSYFVQTRALSILRRYPAALPNERIEECPLHDEPVGPTTHMCLWCHEHAWMEIGDAFLASRGEGQRPRRSRRAEPKAEGQKLWEAR